jgi:hypothetical protein
MKKIEVAGVREYGCSEFFSSQSDGLDQLSQRAVNRKERSFISPLTLCSVPPPPLCKILAHLSQAVVVEPTLPPLLKKRVKSIGQVDTEK